MCQCSSYTKFEKGLCYDCYQEKKGTKPNDHESSINEKDISSYSATQIQKQQYCVLPPNRY